MSLKRHFARQKCCSGNNSQHRPRLALLSPLIMNPFKLYPLCQLIHRILYVKNPESKSEPSLASLAISRFFASSCACTEGKHTGPCIAEVSWGGMQCTLRKRTHETPFKGFFWARQALAHAAMIESLSVPGLSLEPSYIRISGSSKHSNTPRRVHEYSFAYFPAGHEVQATFPVPSGPPAGPYVPKGHEHSVH